ncbi:hypothetical protein BC830DRAFT_1152688 [Chytriomyces sp. MP71]|nr:hypothetical protein BC830DRAFT_1152688 [Chytriomyces sp. MP71]
MSQRNSEFSFHLRFHTYRTGTPLPLGPEARSWKPRSAKFLSTLARGASKSPVKANPIRSQTSRKARMRLYLTRQR